MYTYKEGEEIEKQQRVDKGRRGRKTEEAVSNQVINNEGEEAEREREQQLHSTFCVHKYISMSQHAS